MNPPPYNRCHWCNQPAELLNATICQPCAEWLIVEVSLRAERDTLTEADLTPDACIACRPAAEAIY